MEIKDDTYAYIKLVRSDGTTVDLIDSSDASGRSNSYSNFILQSVQEARAERHQLIETFGDTFLFLFGESPRFLQVQATLLNSFDFNWKAEFQYNYDNYLRGTKAIEQGARCYLFYDNNVVEGYIINCTLAEAATDPMNIQLQFQFYVLNAKSISLIDTGGSYPTRSSATVPDTLSLIEPLNIFELEELTGVPFGGSPTTPIVVRDNPIRSKTKDNTDEYTSPMQPTLEEFKASQAQANKNVIANQEVPSLPVSLSDAMESYGVSPEDAQSPQTAKDLGYGPNFSPGGVGLGSGQGQMGAYATFGASASAGASFSVGGYAGVQVGASLEASAYAGVGASAQVGAYAGVTTQGQFYGSAYAGANAGFGFSAGASAGFSVGVGASASIGATTFSNAPTSAPSYGFPGSSGYDAGFNNQLADSFGLAQLTGKTSGQAAAYASSQATFQAGGYASASAYAAAQAGGYAGYGASLGYGGYGYSMSASFAGQVGAGASVSVGGDSTAFGMVSVGGELNASISFGF